MAVKSIRSVGNALRVVEVLSEQPGTGVTAIARELGIDKMAVQRILVTLAERGWIRNDGSGRGRWELAPRVTRIGRQVTANLREQARAHIERLARDTGETVLLWSLDGDTAVVIDAIDSPHPLKMTVPIGTEVPVTGDELGSLFAPADRARRAGAEYLVLADAYPNSVAVIAPVRGSGGDSKASLTVVAPRARLSDEQAAAIGPELVRIAHVLELVV